MGKTVEAKLLLTGEERVSREIAKVIKALRETEKAAQASGQVEKLARALAQAKREGAALAAVQSARGPLETTVKNLAAAERQTASLARQYDLARRAQDAFARTQKTLQTAEAAQEAAKLAAETKRVGDAHRAAERDVRRLASAMEAETATLRSAEKAASALGLDLSTVARQQANLARQTDLTTKALRTQIVAEEQAARTSARAASRRQARREALGTIGAGASVVAAHRGREIGLKAIGSAAEMDYAVRYQHIATDVSEASQRKLLLPQAKRIGQETRFSNIDVVRAQTATMQGLPYSDPEMKAQVGAAIVDQARNYAVLFESTLTKGSEGLRTFLQNTNKDISTPEKAVAEATRGSNLIIKAAKAGGMDDDDAQQFMKYALPTGIQAGFTDTTAMALGALARRSGLRGDEAGVFMRAAASKLISPTKGGLEAEIAAGIDRQKFQKMPAQLDDEAFEKIGKGRFGVDFNASQRGRLSAIFRNGDLVTNREAFISQVSQVVGESFDKVSRGPNKGKMKAQDAQKVAKLANDFLKMSVESTDVEGLLQAHMNSPKFTIALRNKFYTDKHGGKAGILANKFDQFREVRGELDAAANDPDFGSRRAKYMTEGLGGAIDNLKGSFETLILNLGTANAGLIKLSADGIAKVADAFANLSETQQQAIGVGGAAAVTAGGAFGTYTIAKKLLGFGPLDRSATALTHSAALLDAAAIKLAGGTDPKDLIKQAAPGSALALGAVTTGIVAGGAAASLIANEAVKNEEFAKHYRENPLLGADPGGYGLAAGILGAPDHSVPVAPSMTLGNRDLPLTIRPGGSFGLTGPLSPQEFARTGAQVGTEAGERAGQGVADGLKSKTPAVLEQGRFILEKVQGILSEGADLPIRLKVAPGIDKTSLDGFPGGGIVKASFNPGGGMVSGRGGANAFGGSIPPGGALDSTYRGPRAVGSGSGVGHIASQSERAAYIRQSAIARGIDPNVALSVAQSEGFYKYVGDQGRSFGDWQLFTGGGVGNRALQAGINVRDPNTWRQQTDFALDVAKREGWGQWYGAARVGIGRWQGLRGKPPGPVGGPEQAGTFPNGAPRVLKPRSMPDAPGVTMPDRRIPEAPPGGIGGARGTGSLGHVADRMDAAVARMAEMGWRSHHVVEVSAGPGLEARTRGMRVQATGPVRADTGISMPHTRKYRDTV